MDDSPERTSQTITHPDRIGGTVALTKYNRQERDKVIAALKRLGVDQEELQSLIGPEPPRVTVSKCSPAFKIPSFVVTEQNLEEWVEKVDEAWERHREKIITEWGAWVNAGQDQPFAKKQQRGPGAGDRNAEVDLRYEWAALRLRGMRWQAIAGDYLAGSLAADLEKAVDRIRHAANAVLDDACMRDLADRNSRARK